MPSSVFEIKEHTLECQHIREYARATSNSQEDVLRLAIKQYIPLDNPNPQAGDLTIIGAHANGFPKELYEPVWEDLHARSKANGFRIRSIWIADVAHQGVSGILNEELLGNDPSWLDHSRDLLHMINMFRSEMPMPIVGMGHSFGGAILCNVALMHPRLLSTVVLMDPVIQPHASTPGGISPVQSSTFRRDLWPSRAEAIATFARSMFYQSWDRRVFDRWCQFGIRETPSKVYPEENGSATLSTTKHQECFTFMRPSWDGISPDGSMILRRDVVPDLNLDQPQRYPLYRPEPLAILRRLGELRPSVLYIFGEKSGLSPPDWIKEKMEITGNAPGGSGGVKEGRVKEVTLQGYGHLIAMEASERCADAAAAWFGQEVKRFEAERKAYEEWTRKSLSEKQTMSEEWKKHVGGPLQQPPKSKI
ncbi:Abhydrolase domain-containing protein [Lachnellula willkommii]|uniref:Abhydrolase domain-containing protein n=1 Tax=Lachnellula willkommii TaxID=215461 RepID=A0A559M1C1_9HELO|nr:Abhydrolase domain-containing protein [Lachnellula willkommii]